MNSKQWETVYQQTLEAIRYLARNSSYNTSELLHEVSHDILCGKYESNELPKELQFWSTN